MRRLALIIVLLVTHGTAVWWGMAGGPDQASTALQLSLPREEDVLDLAKLLEPEPAKPPPPAPLSMEDQVNAALLALPEDADFEALASEPASKKYQPASPEAAAAFCRWMERDPLAALRFSVASVDAKDGRCIEGIRRYLEKSTPQEVSRLLTGVPEAAGAVLKTATAIAARKEGVAGMVSLASALNNSGFAFQIFNGIAPVEGLAEQLPAIRALLDERGMREFLGSLARRGATADFLDEIAAAGFSQAAIDYFEKTRATSEAAAAEKRQLAAMSLADQIREGIETISSHGPGEKLQAEVPEFSAWCLDFADGRKTATELMADFRTAAGNPQGMDPQLHRFLFKSLYPMNPSAAIEWLKGEEADWQEIVKKTAQLHGSGEVSRFPITVEAVWHATEGLSPAEQEASGMLGMLLGRYEVWQKRDPEDCMAAAGDLPPGPLKDRLMQFLEKGGDR